MTIPIRVAQFLVMVETLSVFSMKAFGAPNLPFSLQARLKAARSLMRTTCHPRWEK
jgi:hypothetical protein